MNPLTTDVRIGIKRQILSIRTPVESSDTSINVEEQVGKHTAGFPPVTLVNKVKSQQLKLGDHSREIFEGEAREKSHQHPIMQCWFLS